VQSQGGLLRKPNTTGGNQRNSSSSNTNAILSGANSNLGALQEPPPSPLSVTAAALASTAGGHANALSSRNIVVSNVSYPANEPLEDRFDYKDYLGGGGGSGGGGGGVSGNSSSFSYSPTLLATVLDGHGGWQVADFARRTLLSAIETELENCPVASNSNTNNDSSSSNTSNQLVEEEDKFVNSSWHLGSALARAFARIDRSFLSAVKPAFELGFGSVAHVGACALAAAVTRDSIVIANAGDCRAVLGRIHSGPTAPPSAIGAPVYFFSPLSLSGDLSFNSISENSNENSFFDPSSHITRQWGTKNTTSTTTLETMKKSISSDIGTIWHQASSSTSSSFSNTTSSFSLPSQSTTSDILPTTSSSSISSSLLSPPSSSSLSSSLSTNNSFFYSAVSLSHDHNAREPREKARLAAAHPGEDDVVVCKPGNASACYVKGRLQPTRSLGDGYLKDSEFNVPARIGRMWGRHIKAPYTPPYVSA
jgi:serine/threonine protein phosphatase PrpC